MITRGEIAGEILRVLHKTPQYQGFYTDDKINDAIEDCMDYISTTMFLANEGWQTKLRHLTTVANQISVPIPPDITMIRDVRYLFAGEYLPLVYRTAERASQVQANSGLTQYATNYRILDNALYFNPPLVEGGTDYLQIEYHSFPKRLQDDNDFIEGHFYKPMKNYIKWRSASILVAPLGKPNPEWRRFEEEWRDRCETVITKRNTAMTFIRDFEP